MTDGKSSGDQDVSMSSDEMKERREAASQEYRARLKKKAATMRAAVLDGETTDERVLQVADALERLAGNDN